MADSPRGGPLTAPGKGKDRKSLKPTKEDFSAAAMAKNEYGLSTTPSLEHQRALQKKWPKMGGETVIYRASVRKLSEHHGILAVVDNPAHTSLRGPAGLATAADHARAITASKDEWTKVDLPSDAGSASAAQPSAVRAKHQ